MWEVQAVSTTTWSLKHGQKEWPWAKVWSSSWTPQVWSRTTENRCIPPHSPQNWSNHLVLGLQNVTIHLFCFEEARCIEPHLAMHRFTLVLCSGNCSDETQGTIWSARGWMWIGDQCTRHLFAMYVAADLGLISSILYGSPNIARRNSWVQCLE